MVTTWAPLRAFPCGRTSAIPCSSSSPPPSLRFVLPPRLLLVDERAHTRAHSSPVQIVHAITGVVRSPLMTTLMQVASRLLLTWGIANIAPIAQNHYFLASMVRPLLQLLTQTL